ncbi:MAG: hypothetical protein KGK11_14775, partial [Sphingomonadales bacterium]|nr:hypothetical protein [Sphingomonadales bacterium]
MAGKHPNFNLDVEAWLEAQALAYVARFATTAARLHQHLLRKARAATRAETTSEPPDAAIAAIVARFVAAGYVDDAGFAEARAA